MPRTHPLTSQSAGLGRADATRSPTGHDGKPPRAIAATSPTCGVLSRTMDPRAPASLAVALSAGRFVLWPGSSSVLALTDRYQDVPPVQGGLGRQLGASRGRWQRGLQHPQASLPQVH